MLSDSHYLLVLPSHSSNHPISFANCIKQDPPQSNHIIFVMSFSFITSHPSDPVAFPSMQLNHLREVRNGIVKLVINLLDNNRRSALVGGSQLGGHRGAEGVGGRLGVLEGALDEGRGGETEDGGVELGLVSLEVVEEGEDVGLEVQDWRREREKVSI